MTEFERREFHNVSSKPSHPWGQIFISIAAVIVTFIGAKIEGFDWVIYITIPILAVAFVLMISDTAIVKYAINKTRNYKDRKVISNKSNEYLEFFDNFKVVKDITEIISGMEWGEIKSPRYHYPSNRLSDLSVILSDKNHSKLSKAIFLNYALNVFIEEADRFIQESDYLVVQRKVTYKYEHDKSKLLKLIRKYDAFRELHDDFCKKTNEITTRIYLRQFYERTFSFMPKDIAPISESKV